MSHADAELKAGIQKTLAIQLLIALITSLGFACVLGVLDALAALFGGGSAIALAALLAFKVYRLAQRLKEKKPVASAVVLLGFAPRLILVLGLFWIGLGLLQLPPIPMISCFILTHLGYLLNFYRFKY